VANIERCVSNGSSGSVTGARVRSMEPAVTLVHGETRHASRTVVPKLARVTPTPTLHDPRDANHVWVDSIAAQKTVMRWKGIAANR